jgi:hypothetical protein
VTTDEFLEARRHDPAFAALQEDFAAREASNRRSYELAAASLLSELRAAGYDVRTVGGLRERRVRYRSAVPILVRWLPRIDDRYVKEDIVRTLSVPWASAAAPALVQEFRSVQDDTGRGLRWAIGNALEVTADDRVFGEIAAIAQDRRWGPARQMVVAALGNMRDPRVLDLLAKLAKDEEVAGYAVMALGKLRAKRGRSIIEGFVDHPDRWIRIEARKALKRIDAADTP